MSRSAQPAGDLKTTARSLHEDEPQTSACQKTEVGHGLDLSLGTYNCRGLSREDQLLYLMEELKKVNCDVLGICETRRRKELLAKWKDGSEIFLGCAAGQKSVGGIGFIIRRKWSRNIISCRLLSARVGILVMHINKKKTIKIIQVYAPTSASDDEEVEDFYRELDEAEQERSTYTVIMGDFNAKLGRGRPTETFIGKYGSKERNERGERLAAMAEAKGYYVGNSWFRKKPARRWMWISSNAEVKNKIEFILVNKKRLLKDVGVIPLFNTGSDHRLLRAFIHIDDLMEARVLMKANPGREKKHTLDEAVFQNALESAVFHPLEDIDADYEHFTNVLKDCVRKAQVEIPSNRKTRISEETRQLMRERRSLKRNEVNNVEYSLLSKLIRRKLREDIQRFKQERILKAAEERRSTKKCKRSLALYKNNLKALRDKSGVLVESREGMEAVCKEFYTDLLSSKRKVPPPALPESSDKPLPVLISEVRCAIQEMDVGKAPGKDGVTAEILKIGGHRLWKELAERFSRYLELKRIPRVWKVSKTILLHKKGEKEDLKNYRSICLLSQIYKVFTKIITKRITSILDEQQPREQAGFRKGYSTRDHLFCLTQILERSREYKLPLCIVFVDFEKAFDSVELNAVLQSLAEQGVQREYIELLRNANTNCTTEVTLFANPISIPVGKGVKQGDTISPKLFSACLEMVMRKMNWRRGLKIDGEYLTHLRFADDIVLLGNNVATVQQMLRELEKEGKKVGLKINRSKTKFMTSAALPRARITLGGEALEEVESYVYLGQEVNMRNDIAKEISRRRQAGWLKFNQEREVLKSDLDQKRKAEIFNSTVIPAMIYGSETWATTAAEERKLEVTVRAMERSVLGISLRQRVPNEEIRRQSGFRDIVDEIRKSKLSWAGHVSRMRDDRWTSKVLHWYPRGVKRPLGRPPKRWEDFIKESCGKTWRRLAESREEWNNFMKTGRRAAERRR